MTERVRDALEKAFDIVNEPADNSKECWKAFEFLQDLLESTPKEASCNDATPESSPSSATPPKSTPSSSPTPSDGGTLIAFPISFAFELSRNLSGLEITLSKAALQKLVMDGLSLLLNAKEP